MGKRDKSERIADGAGEMSLILTDLVEGRCDPVDLRSFRRRGMVIPCGCVRMERFPEHYGFGTDERYVRSSEGDRQTLLDLSVDPIGRPCMVATTPTSTEFLYGMPCNKGSWDLVPRSNTSAVRSARILGYHGDEVYVYVEVEDGSGHEVRIEGRIYRDGRLIRVHINLDAATLLGDGSVIYALGQNVCRGLSVITDDHPRQYHGFAMLQKDFLAIWSGCSDEDTRYFGFLGASEPLTDGKYRPLDIIRTMSDVPVEVVMVSAERGSKVPVLGFFDRGMNFHYGRIMGKNHYLRGGRELVRDRLSYVGQTSRGKLECQVVNGVEGPPFTRVSPAFLDAQGKIAYYAEADGYLFLMDAPT